jgi:hypothetical protein
LRAAGRARLRAASARTFETEASMSEEIDSVVIYETDEEVEDVLRRFESGALRPSEFKHRQHLTVALLYLLRLPESEVHARMRDTILRFLARHRLDANVYHETITAFWLRRVRCFVRGADTERPAHELANELINQCTDSRLVFEYFSRELIETKEARSGWMEPDLKVLDF